MILKEYVSSKLTFRDLPQQLVFERGTVRSKGGMVGIVTSGLWMGHGGHEHYHMHVSNEIDE
jgi:hypothetical protein